MLTRAGFINSDANSETSTLVARMAIVPTPTRRDLIDKLVGALKAGGVWQKLDALYVMAAANEQAARLNWIGDRYNLVAVNSPAFEPDRGFSGDGSTSYLSTGLAKNGGAHFGQNDAYLGHWNLAEFSSDAAQDLGSTPSYVNPRNASGYLVCRSNFSSATAPGQSVSVPSAIGYSSWSRRFPTQFDINKNGALLSTRSIGTEILNAVEFTILYAANFSPRQAAASLIGAGLTSDQETATYAALLSYMQGVGAA